MSDPTEKSQTARLATAVADAAAAPQSVPVNVYETDRALVVVAPLPGVMHDDVTITVEPGRVTIDADLRTAAPKAYVVNEWTYGPYHREVEVPAGHGSSAEAKLANGQLALRLLEGDAPEGGYELQPEPAHPEPAS